MESPLFFYKKAFSLEDAFFSRIEHEESLLSTVYKVIQPKKPTQILKIYPRKKDYEREYFFLKYLKDDLFTPKLVQSLPPSQFDGAILMNYIEGTLLSFASLTLDLAFQIGAYLASLHLRKVEFYGDVTKNGKKYLDAGSYFGEKFFEELDECKDHLPKNLIDFSANFLEKNKDLLKSVDGPLAIHRDFRPGNILVQNGKIQGIIDWASARFGFAEQDFCQIVHKNTFLDPKRKDHFFAGYTSKKTLPSLEILPLLQLGRALAVIGFSVKTGQKENFPIYKDNRTFLEEFFQKNF